MFVTNVTKTRPIYNKYLIMRFLGNILSTIIGIFIFCLLFFFGILLIGAIFGSSSKTTHVEENSVLELNLEAVTNDYGGKLDRKSVV